MFFHILNHATYHRGSIARALDQAGVATNGHYSVRRVGHAGLSANKTPWRG